MKTSESLLRQITSYIMFSGFLILFAYGTFGEETSDKPTTEATTFIPPTASDLISVTSSSVKVHPTEFPTEKLTKKGADVDISSKAHPVSKLLVATSSSKETTSVSTLPLKHLSTPISDTITEKREPATLKQTKPVDATTGIHITAKQETTTTVASAPDKIETTKVVGKPHTTVGEPTSLSTTAAAGSTVGSTGLKPRSTKKEKGIPGPHVQDDSPTPGHVQGDSTTPGQHIQVDSTTPGKHVQGDSTAHNISSRAPEIQYTTGASTPGPSEADSGTKKDTAKGNGGVIVTPTTKTPHSDPRTTVSPAKNSRPMTVAIILSILLLMILLIALLACWRRRRHSGSTSFKTAAWAGQAALPDDSGLDKDVEQEALTTGERETRRATLTTFFGKRQSRVPSVAMEEVVQKETGNTEEAQHLIDGDVSSVSSLERSGEANGKLPEHTVQCSQEEEFPLPPANQEETPPTPQE